MTAYSPPITNSFFYAPNVLSVQSVVTSKTLSPGVPTKVIGANFGRHYLMIQNVGTNPLSFGMASLSPGQGIGLDGAGAANGQGGSYEFRRYVPGDEIWAVSAAGTTIVVLEAF